ncbi:putative leucine-rich repeat receptor-like protein kinase At2g19210, partial [Cornus florida]|uniref:putative leucine-rich repeat receptor-like protein kinase At2g19210 n=1 Tax=Cornus florida TaxID=4283 RepID=UPI00289F12D7
FAQLFIALLFFQINSNKSLAGFISIDCGMREASSYTDTTTGLHYSADANIVETGLSMPISSEFFTNSGGQQFLNVRSFPEGTRNCYTLRPQGGRGNKYLIRAWFLYGNYDDQKQPPIFDLHIGVNFWKTVTIYYSTSTWRKEIIHVPTKDYINVCLVNTGHGTPFISALELRPLNNSMYERENNVRLEFWLRQDLGSIRDDYVSENIRYKDDVYDSVWRPYSQNAQS